ncbi:hypothetical protein HYW20_07275 [Candidatus Woesearchaeota archaeon]|nr:hypothetical protein [Candidatus Woesearchaeota archaeon]
MNREKYLHFVASFLIALVLTLPFYVTSVYAAIDSATASGGDGIGGYAKETDFLIFNAHALISDDAITPNQVRLGRDPGIQFDTCTASASGGYDCTLRFPDNGTESFDARTLPFTINLFNDDGIIDDSKSGSITIDNKEPEITLSTPQEKFSSNEKVIVDYIATDFACNDPSCSDKCVGIKSIEFYTLDGVFRQKAEPAADDCSIVSAITIDSNIFNDGMNSVFATATDKFGQASEETSVTFDVDTTRPLVLADTFKILRSNISIGSFSSNRVAAEVVVDISGNDLDLSSVTADLSDLNPDQGLKNVMASCAASLDGVSTCRWQIELNPKTQGVKTIFVNASDSSGNRGSASISKFLIIDDEGPVVTSLSTATSTEIQVFGTSTGNTITAVFDEATGLNPNEVLLHVGNSAVRAARCSKDLSWTCVWDNVNFGASNQMSIQSDTTDVFGNFVRIGTDIQVVVDTSPPFLRSLNMSPVGGIIPAFSGLFKIGDKIAVVANVTEDNDVFAVADFSKFIDGASSVAGSCQRQQADEHVCTWLTDSINLQFSGTVNFNFSDNAGNKITTAKQLQTFGLENATVPDFWSNVVSCSPKTIDRSLGPLINQRVYCHVSLQPKSTSKQVSTVFIGQASCSGDTSITDSIGTFNTETGSTSPVIKLTLRKDDFRIDNASLSCSLQIFSKVGSSNSITKNPEIENVRINIGFYNLPLGELGADVQKKIDDAKDDAKGIWKLIGSLNKLVNIAKKICQIIHTIYNIVGVLYNVAYILGIWDVTAQKTFLGYFTITPTAIAGCQTQTHARVAAQTNAKILNTFCDIVTCKQSFLWGDAVKNWINDPTKSLGQAGYLVSPGQYLGSKTDGKSGTYDYINEVSVDSGGKPRPVSEYMDPQHNLIVATLFECIPGIIYGLDKYRQIKCLYADCLENAVSKDGIPITTCEDLKAYSTCKYIYTELFAVFPWTAVLDHFLGIIKESLSNPFAALGVAISVGCYGTCSNTNAESRLSLWTLCEAARFANQLGVVVGNVKNIIDEGFTIRQDYCSRLDLEDKKTTTAPTTETSNFNEVKQK